MSHTLTAGASLPALVTALSRAGWGPELSGRDLHGVRNVLAALSRLLDRRSGAGHVTVEQIAAAAGYSPRWTRTRLYLLEDAELIVWHRGTIKEQVRTPSWIRVDKQAVLALVRLARDARDAALAELRDLYRERLARLRLKTLPPRKRFRRSIHEELASTLPPTGRVTPPPVVDKPPASDPKTGAALVRAALAEARGKRT